MLPDNKYRVVPAEILLGFRCARLQLGSDTSLTLPGFQEYGRG